MKQAVRVNDDDQDDDGGMDAAAYVCTLLMILGLSLLLAALLWLPDAYRWAHGRGL